MWVNHNPLSEDKSFLSRDVESSVNSVIIVSNIFFSFYGFQIALFAMNGMKKNPEIKKLKLIPLNSGINNRHDFF